METEFQIGPHTYRAGKLDAITQFHVMRRLGTVASSFGSALEAVNKAGGFQALMAGKGPEPLTLVEPILSAIGHMSDDDSNYVINKCLAVVSRRLEGDKGWARVLIGNGQLMYQDLDMAALMQIVWKVLESSLSSFLAVLPLPSRELK